MVELVGEGGMAAVYKSHQPAMERYVALKILPQHFASDPQFIGRFEQEARVIAQLQHPHILPVFDYGREDGYTYIVMPYVKSGTLSNLLTGKPLPLDQSTTVISQIGDALDYAHSLGIIHRDIKPSNILVDERGNCLLTDFGIAKIVEGTANFTRTGGIVGTPAYMSPEQGLGQRLDGRSDIYSLAVVLYETVTGRVPYVAETPMAIVVKHINDPLPSPRSLNPDLPEAVELVLLKALAKAPNDRYASAGDMVRAVHWATEVPVEADVTVLDQPVVKPETAPKRQVTPTPEQPVAAIVEAPKVGEARDRKSTRKVPVYVGGVAVALLMGIGLILLGISIFTGPQEEPAIVVEVETPTAEQAATPTAEQAATAAAEQAATPAAEQTATTAAEQTATTAAEQTATAAAIPLVPEQLISTLAYGASSVTTADLDDDGDQDVIAVSNKNDQVLGHEKIEWFENINGDGSSWTTHLLSNFWDSPVDVKAADLDADGDIDFVVTSHDHTERISWFDNNGDAPPIFTERTVTQGYGFGYTDVEIIDMNQDGDLDIVVAASYQTDKVLWFENDGASLPTFSVHVISDAFSEPEELHVADLDGDGDNDVVVVDADENKLIWFESSGGNAPTFTTIVLSDIVLHPKGIEVQDINNDGDLDILVGSGDLGVVLFESSGGGEPTFSNRAIPSSAGAYEIRTVDFDMDGAWDVVSVNPGPDIVTWYENDGSASPNFTSHEIPSSGDQPFNLSIDDLDSDGDPDILVVFYADDKVAWYENLRYP